MGINSEDREKLVAMIGEDATDQLELANAAKAQTATEERREFKAEDETATAPDAPPAAEPPAAEPDSEDETAPKALTAADVAQAALTAVQPVLEAMSKKMGEQVQALTAQVAALEQKQAADVVARELEMTPAASLVDLMRKGMIANVVSALGANETQVDGRTKLAKDKPPEAKASPQTAPFSVMPSVLQALAWQDGDWRRAAGMAVEE